MATFKCFTRVTALFWLMLIGMALVFFFPVVGNTFGVSTTIYGNLCAKSAYIYPVATGAYSTVLAIFWLAAMFGICRIAEKYDFVHFPVDTWNQGAVMTLPAHTRIPSRVFCLAILLLSMYVLVLEIGKLPAFC